MPLKVISRKGTEQLYLRGTVRRVPVYETTGTSNPQLAEAIRIKREAQILNESVLGPRVSRTFDEAAIGYLDAKDPGRSQRDAIIGRERISDGKLSACLLTDFGAMLCSRIDQAALDKVIRQRFRGRSPATVQRSLIMPLTAVLNWAARSPRKWCDVPAFDRPAGKLSRGRTRWLDYQEADRLLAAASPHLWRLILFLSLSGARIGEALALEWDDVDLGAGWATLRNTKRGQRGHLAGEDRGVPLHPQLVVMLANLPRPRSGEGFVFLTPAGLPYAEREGGGHIKTAWRLTTKRAGIADLRVHDLRHTFATWLLLARVQEEVRETIMGHRSSLTGRRYAHVPQPAAIEAVSLLPSRAKSVQSARPYPGKRVQDQGVG